MSTLGNRRVTDLHLEIPPAGGWTCYCHLDSGEPPASGLATLKLGDLELVGTILAPDRGGADSPAHPSVVVVGGAGWRNPLTRRGLYESAGGVRLTDVLRDLAGLAGEPYDAPVEVNLGKSYGWTSSSSARTVRVSAVLAEFVSRGALPWWRVAANGRTRFDAWPTLPAADTHGRIVARDLAVGAREIALDNSVAAWLPGATVQSTRIARVTFDERNSELRAKVWAA